MNLLETWFRSPLGNALGWALLHFVWQGAVLALLLAVLLVVTTSARRRYTAACLILLTMPVVFVVTVALNMPTAQVAVATTRMPNTIGQRSLWSNGREPLLAGSARTAVWPAGFLPWIAPCWLAGVIFFYGRGIGAWIAVYRLRRRGVCSASADWQERLNRLCVSMGVKRTVALLESCFAETPALIGYLRPAILIPLGCFTGLSVSQLECILVHELAHIRRQDYLVNLLQTCVEGLLFYHPAAWWVSSVVRAERENCCDDVVVELAGDARLYAATLARLEQRRAVQLDAALAATGGSLMKRIRRLTRQPESGPNSAAPAAVAAFLLVTFAAVLTAWPGKIDAVVPEQQTSMSQVPQLAPAAFQQAPAQDWSAYVIQVRGKGKPVALLAAQAEQIPARGYFSSAATSQGSTMTDQERKAKEKALRQELATPYRKWLNEDVSYIITDEERSAFLRIQSDDEREKFIEQLWLSRDPTPGTSENEFKEEHYRRIAYANEHFSSRIPGWKTDRGRIYITYGPPDEMEDHSSGGIYQRPAEQGGGTTSTFPFQHWRYRYIEGIGSHVIIEFVDPTMSGEFHMTMDPSEKNVLLNLPNAGLTILGQMGIIDQNQAAAAAGSSTQSKVQVFRSEQDNRVQVVTGGADGLTSFLVNLDEAGVKYSVSMGITTANGRTVAGLQEIAPKTPFVRQMKLAPGSYILSAFVRNVATGEIRQSSVNFTIQ